MRRGLFQDYANQVCQMAVGWRLSIADLPMLVAKQRGEVTMNILSGDVALNGETASFSIYDEVAAWLSSALQRDEVPPGTIESLEVRIDFDIADASEGRNEARRQVLCASSNLVTRSGVFSGVSQKRELWTRKSESDPWVILDM